MARHPATGDNRNNPDPVRPDALRRALRWLKAVQRQRHPELAPIHDISRAPRSTNRGSCGRSDAGHDEACCRCGSRGSSVSASSAADQGLREACRCCGGSYSAAVRARGGAGDVRGEPCEATVALIHLGRRQRPKPLACPFYSFYIQLWYLRYYKLRLHYMYTSQDDKIKVLHVLVLVHVGFSSLKGTLGYTYTNYGFITYT